MSKTLTISIAAYNVEQYIRETLNSLVNSKYIDDLEIFVVDDGGTDLTFEIAREFQQKYPESVIPVHKINGGYGSTVNYSLEHATGKYFKLLDGDDWFQTEELDKLVEKLKTITTDVVVNPYLKGNIGSMHTVGFKNYLPINEEIKICDIDNQPTIGMWALCYKTSVLKKASLKLPEKIFYTDQIFCTIPIAYADSIQYLDYYIYCYRLGRDGQSVSKDSRIRNCQMTMDICKSLIEFTKKEQNNKNYNYLLNRVASYYFSALKTILLSPMSKEIKNRFKTFDSLIKGLSLDIYKSAESNGKLGKMIVLSRKTNYFALYLVKILYPKGIENWG